MKNPPIFEEAPPIFEESPSSSVQSSDKSSGPKIEDGEFFVRLAPGLGLGRTRRTRMVPGPRHRHAQK